MITNSSVRFFTENEPLAKLFASAEEKALLNIKNFAGREVLIEGGGYEKIWLETQPMGGEMYAKRNLTVALNNQLFFMENIREDGRLPGSIALIDGVVTPQFNKFQGFCFPSHALNMYYLTGKDRVYLEFLFSTLSRFDDYLWKTRDSDGDGCLESWCVFDTGEDNALRYGDAPNAWSEEVPPSNSSVVPMSSIDIMSFSYSARETLAKISEIMGDEQQHDFYLGKANEVKDKIKTYLWCEKRGACFDRDKNHVMMPTLTHNTLRAMYWNSLSQDMADRFVNEHLLNPQEFFTTMPLPSVAVNDPLFRNVTTNNWSGQSEALTYQRAILALENYGYDYIIPTLGKKLFNAIGDDCIFVQQYDPFTSKPSLVSLEGEQDAYGPAILSVLEYISRMYGVHIQHETVYWGSFDDCESVYEQEWGDNLYRIENSKDYSTAYINNKKIFQAEKNKKIITTLSGELLFEKSYTA